MRLEGRAALVTGSGHGIGRAIAARYAEEGAAVVVADINEEGAVETVRRIEAAGGRALAIRADVGVSQDVEQAVRACVETYGRLDILVNNAGIGGGGPVEEVQEEVFDRVVNCNLRGTWLGVHYAVPHMKKAGGGVILSISSVQGILGWNHAAIYSATKAGILGATRSWAVELAPYLIRVNAICPGAIRVWTPEEFVTRRLGPEYVAEFRARFAARLGDWAVHAQPLPRAGLPEDIAHCALFLASDEAALITGQYIVVDGGLTAAHYQPDHATATPRHEVWKEIREWADDIEKRKGGSE